MIGGTLLALLAASSPAPPRFGSQTDAIRVDVSVSRDGEPLAGLVAADFEVRDQGVPQHLELVSRSEQTVHAILILDLSDSLTAAQQARIRRSARDMLARLETRDRATLLVFAHDLRLVSGPAEPAVASAAVDRAYEWGGTAVYDALYAGVALSAAVPGARPFVLLFSDGLDRVSWLSPWKVLEAARHSDATVYLASPADTPGGGLPGLAADTGGYVIGARPGPELDEAFTRVLTEVKNRYLLVYEPQGVPRPGWHELSVRLKKRKGKVRARRAYCVAPP